MNATFTGTGALKDAEGKQKQVTHFSGVPDTDGAKSTPAEPVKTTADHTVPEILDMIKLKFAAIGVEKTDDDMKQLKKDIGNKDAVVAYHDDEANFVAPTPSEPTEPPVDPNAGENTDPVVDENGEIEVTVTQETLDANPEMVEQGIVVGQVIKVPAESAADAE